jgi:hypothetical protein
MSRTTFHLCSNSYPCCMIAKYKRLVKPSGFIMPVNEVLAKMPYQYLITIRTGFKSDPFYTETVSSRIPVERPKTWKRCPVHRFRENSI